MFGKGQARAKPARISTADIVYLAGDALMGTAAVADGRMIPVLILDTSNRPDIDEYVRVHRGGSPGDVRTQWAHVPESDTVILMLSTERPLVMQMLIGFRLAKSEGILVEQILSVGGFHLQSGRPGDRMHSTIDDPRIMVEVPDTGFNPMWDKIFLKNTAARLREKGLARQRSKAAAQEAIRMMREVGDFRFPASAKPNDE